MEKRTSFNLVLEERNILTRIGFKGPSKNVKPALKGAVETGKREALTLVEPAALWTVIDYEETNKHPIFDGASRVALCLCTIGPRLEEVIAGTMETDVLRGLILDAYGSQAVAEISRQVIQDIEERARRMGLSAGKRFAPGYKSWPVEEQAFLFGHLPGHLIGVRLTDSFMMVPRKSYSFRVNFQAPACAAPGSAPSA